MVQHQQWHVTLLFLWPNSYKNYNLINWSKLKKNNKNNEIWSLRWNENFIFSFRISKKWLLLNFSSRTTRLHCGYYGPIKTVKCDLSSHYLLSLSLSLWRQIETSDIPYLGHRKNNYLHLIHVEKVSSHHKWMEERAALLDSIDKKSHFSMIVKRGLIFSNHKI